MDARTYGVNVLGGSVGGIFQAVVGHPFETVKVRLQAQDHRAPSFRGPFDCFWKTLKLEGARGFYKGVQVPLLTTSCSNAALFGINSLTRSLVHQDRTEQIGTAKTMAAAVLAAPLYAVVQCPIDIVKSRLQVQATRQQTVYRGMFHGVWTIARKEGMATFFRGYLPTVSTRALGHPFYFGANDVVKRCLPSGGTEATEKLRVAFAGGCGGIAMWVVCYPADFVKTRMQTARGSDKTSMVATYVSVYREAGVRGFYRGFVPCIMRAFPANAVAFLGHDSVLRAYAARAGKG